MNRAARLTAGFTAAAALAVGMAMPAYAAPPDHDLTPEEIADSVHELEPSVYALEPAITPLETVRRTGSETEMSLQADLLFDFAKWDLTPAAVAKIGELVKEIPQGIPVTVAGHTDSKGDDASNKTLSERRAESVAAAIRAARPDLKLKIEGHGESKPVAKNEVGGKDNPEGRAQNRRVEVRYAS